MTSTSSIVKSKVRIPHLVIIENNHQRQIDLMLDSDVDAIVVNTMNIHPGFLEEYTQVAQEKNTPLFVLTGGITPSFGKPSPRETLGENALNVRPNQYWGVHRGLARIIDEETNTDPKARHKAIMERAHEVFGEPDFYDKPAFIDLLLNPDLRDWADDLEATDKPVIVDCGHIDSKTMYSGNADELSLEEGAVLVQYLRQKGFDARLSVLYNELQFFNTMEKPRARKAIKALYKEAKNTGTHFGVRNQYHFLLTGHGITEDRWKDVMLSPFEGKLIMQCRQDLDKYARGEDVFSRDIGVVTVEADGQTAFAGTGYVVGEGDTTAHRLITKPSLAPNCAMLSAKLNQHYENMGAARVMYLRDEMQWGCAIRNGARTARELYGVKMAIDFIPYMEVKDRVATLPGRELATERVSSRG